MRITETPFFFRTGERPLFGMRFCPEDTDPPVPGRRGNRRGVVICDSLFEEKLWAERVLANLARHLARNGYDVLVFDYFGYGNSVGSSSDTDIRTMERDINDACNLLAGFGAGRLTLISLRWGSAPTCRVAAARDDVDSVLLVNPVAKWKKELMTTLRANVAGQYAIFKKTAMTRDQIVEELSSGGDCVREGYRMNNVEGYYFSRDFLVQCPEVNLPVEMPDRVASFSIVTIPDRGKPIPKGASKLAEEFRSAGVECDSVVLEDDDVFWLNNFTFTSVTPVLYKYVTGRLRDLDKSAGTTGNLSVKAPEGSDVPDFADSFLRDGVRETIVSFDSSDENRLYGVTYIPEGGDAKDTGFVFSNGGLIGMNGAYRFNTRGARRFAAAGYPCVCFDPHGMGKAHGRIENNSALIIFRQLANGLLSDDVADAARFFKTTAGTKHIALMGVCGGAITNMIGHARCDDVDISFELSVPVMLPALQRGMVKMTPGYAKFFLGMYIRKIWDPGAWWRFITFRSDYERIYKSMAAVIRGFFERVGIKKKRPERMRSKQATGAPRSGIKNTPATGSAPAKAQGSGTTPPAVTDELTFNPVFLDSYRKITGRKGQIVFVYGENDNYKWEFTNDFAANYPDDINAGKGLITTKEIRHANHMYTQREWQDQIFEYSLDWLDKATFPE